VIGGERYRSNGSAVADTSFGIVSLVAGTFGALDDVLVKSRTQTPGDFAFASRLVRPVLLLARSDRSLRPQPGWRVTNFTAVDVSRYRVANSPLVFDHPASQ
jgi:hypothetical protein